MLCEDSSLSGLFTAAYRIIQDYYNNQLQDIDIFQTVMEMRDSGLDFIYSQDQIRFIFQCLHDEAKKKEEREEALQFSIVYVEDTES